MKQFNIFGGVDELETQGEPINNIMLDSLIKFREWQIENFKDVYFMDAKEMAETYFKYITK